MGRFRSVRALCLMLCLVPGVMAEFPMEASAADVYPKLNRFIFARLAEFQQIPKPRREALDGLAEKIGALQAAKRPVRLVFICTHNSRRSHFAQVWGQVAAAWYCVDGVTTFSGGTEATACNPRTVEALRRAGLVVEAPADFGSTSNPRYKVTFSAERPAMVCYSKTYHDHDNPQQDFIAILTCSDADEKCPIVNGATARFPLTYDDPKIADETPAEAERYDERSREIAREMLYLFSVVSRNQTATP